MYESKMGFEGDGAAGKENVQSALEQDSLQMLSDLRIRCEELDDALAMLDSTKKEIEGQINQCFQTILRALEERRLVLFCDLESSLQKRRRIIEELMKNMEERSQKLTVTTELIKQYHIHEKGLFNGERVEKYEETNHEIRRRNAEEQLRTLLTIPVPKVLAIDSRGRNVDAVNPKEFSVSLTHRPVHMNEVSVIDPESKAESTALDNSVLIRLKLANPGFYELNVKVLGEHIRNSPYRVHCLPKMGSAAKEWKAVFNELSEHIELRRGHLQYIKRSSSELYLPKLPPPPQALADALSWHKNDLIFAIGARGRGVSEFACPQGAMFTRDTKLVIVDSNNANVQVFTSSGAFLLRFGEFGSEAGQMVRPTSVAETINSNYLISDFDLHCIHVFQPSGSYMSRFGQRNLAGPYDIAVDSKGKIFVVDLKACTVCYFKPTGRFLGHFGARGAADNQFTGPTGIAIDSTDRVFVVDSPVHSVKVFENDGEFLFKFGVNGPEPGCLHLPTRLAFDPHDLLLIIDTGNNRVQVFDKEGQYLWLFTSSLDALNDPRDIAILPNNGLIAVVDTGNYCIKAFNLQNRADNYASMSNENNNATLAHKPIGQINLIERVS
ncbi:Tripartite motif-containing protein 3 [Taenia crassiceps]|uniref:Tripartite motif-containing protein 3 n=1 Tax=Taenia crassiceps TaxID=6207 RepID=A0ABR4QU09_9CEST